MVLVECDWEHCRIKEPARRFYYAKVFISRMSTRLSYSHGEQQLFFSSLYERLQTFLWMQQKAQEQNSLGPPSHSYCMFGTCTVLCIFLDRVYFFGSHSTGTISELEPIYPIYFSSIKFFYPS
ncbi:hypothetical protein ACMFMG_010513 [Clarireedia jacksonii]